MSEKQKRLVLIDGHALAYRAFFGMPDTFTTAEGEKTNAVYGFTNMILAVWKDYDPDYFIVTFDAGDTFRHEMYADYKGTREKMPDDLSHQIGRIEQLVRAFNMPIYTKDGYEADDVLGTLANQAAEQDIEVLIVTGDRDLFQLVKPNIKVVYPGRRFDDREVYDEAAVEERYSLSADKLVDLKALVGDSSDNIPGVAGIGEKGGAKLLQEYATLDGIYENLEQISKAQRNKLEAGRENAYLSQALGRIIIDVPGIELKLDAGRTHDFELSDIANLFVELEFNTIFNRIPGAPADKGPHDFATVKIKGKTGPEPPDGDYQTVATTAALDKLIKQLASGDRLCVDVETDSTDEVQTNLVGIAITPKAGRGYYIPVGHHPPQQASMFAGADDQSHAAQLPLEVVQQQLAPVLADPQITKYMHNAKFDMTVLERYGMPVEPPIFDTMVASWLDNNAPEARHGLKELALTKLNVQMTQITELIGTGKSQITMAEVPIEKATPYAAADVDLTLRLADDLVNALQRYPANQYLFDELEMPLIYVLKDMELAGIKVDVEVLQDISAILNRRLDELSEQIYLLAGQSFNLNSTQQLSDILFNKLGLPTQGLKKTSSGHYSTAAGVLENLIYQHEIVELILEQRTLGKLQSTYVDSLPKLVNPKTDRIHTNYTQIGISTGRLSSAEPNLQNIPIRTPQGREIRRAFVAEPGWKLIAADYSQVELRLLAQMADDPGLQAAFARNEDIHTATAAAVLGIPSAEVDSNQRRIAKTVNFGLAYGQSAFGLAQTTGLSQAEAKQFIDIYFEKYPGVKRYIDETKEMAAEQGYVETLLGRRRDFSNMADLKGPQRGRAEREAINMPIQGTAADIMKLAMIHLHEVLQKKYQARLLLQVHDELIVEAPDEELAEVVPLVEKTMCEAYELDVPLKVEVEVGQNWLEMEDYH